MQTYANLITTIENLSITMLYSGSETGTVIMCWYSPAPTVGVGQHILKVHSVRTMETGINQNSNNQNSLSNEPRNGKVKAIQEHIVEVKSVQEEHLQIEDIDPKLCSHIIYNSGYLTNDSTVVMKTGNKYLNQQQMKGRNT